ncbi:MAG: hypothetical protein H7Y12_06015 [Sphingobacteriaceae bacterium]|nr:hypothetical protein [Cytophagaceae bacterium]
MKTNSFYLIGFALLFLMGCRSRSAFDDVNKILTLYTPDVTDVNKVYKEWRQSFEEEQQGGQSDRRIFRKANYQFPNSSQFRQTLAFASEGSQTTGKLLLTKQLKNGAATQYAGTWEWTESSQTLTLRYTDTELKQSVVQSYEVVTMVQDLLLLKAL